MNVPAWCFLLQAALVLSACDASARELAFPTTPEEIQREFLRPPDRGLKSVEPDRARVGARIHFEHDSASIGKQSWALLDAFAAALSSGLSGKRFLVVGHTDSTGPPAYNIELSRRRASAVRQFLVQRHGIDPSRLAAEGAGASEPLADNGSDSGRSMNRRVEFIMKSDREP